MNLVRQKFPKKSMKRILVGCVISIVSVIVTGCSLGMSSSSTQQLSDYTSSTEQSSGTLTIVTSIAPLYAHVKSIGGENVNVNNLVPPGDSVHRRQLRPRQLQLLEQADLIVLNGRGLESFLDSYIQDFPDAVILDTSLSLEADHPRLHTYDESYDTHQEEYQEEYIDQDMHQDTALEHTKKEKDTHNKDPHVWMDPLMARTQVEVISQTLQELDQKNAEIYQQATEDYIQQIQEKHQQFASIFGVQEYTENPAYNPFPSEYQFVSFHDAYGFFWRRYGLEDNIFDQVYDHHEDQLSVQDMQGLVQAIQDGQVRVLMTEPQMDQGVLDVLVNYIPENSALHTISFSPVGEQLSADSYLMSLQDLYEKFIPVVQEAHAG